MANAADRSGDIAELSRVKRTGDAVSRKKAARSLDKISMQERSPLIRSARHKLVEAVRSGDKAGRKEIDADLAKYPGQVESGGAPGVYSGHSFGGSAEKKESKCDFCGKKDSSYKYVKVTSKKVWACRDCQSDGTVDKERERVEKEREQIERRKRARRTAKKSKDPRGQGPRGLPGRS